MKKSNIALLSVAGLVAGGYYLSQLAATGEALETVTNIRFQGLRGDRAMLRAEVKLINKGSATLRIDNPQVDVAYITPSGKKSILSTIPKSQTVVVRPGQSADFSIDLETLSKAELSSIIGAARFVQLISSGLQFESRIRAKVNYLIPIDETEIINLRLFSR